jgi:hypothetical protein
MIFGRLLDNFVNGVAPPEKFAVESVRQWIIISFCAVMIIFTDTSQPLQVRATSLLLLNIVVRLMFPSAYYPATASIPGILGSPLLARSIAFVAEFALYEVWAVWAQVDFWHSKYYLWAIVLFGEVVSTIGLLVQSELLLFIEDSTWAIHTSVMCIVSYPLPAKMAFFGSFGLAMFFVHLPRRFEILYNRSRAVDRFTSVYEIDPLYFKWNPVPFIFTLTSKKRQNTVAIRKCHFEEKAWVVPMLLGQPILTAFMYWQINNHLYRRHE